MRIHILRGDLTAFDKAAERIGIRDETAFAVADRDGVDVSHGGPAQPGGERRSDSGAYQTALMASDRVEGQGRIVLGHRHDMPERHQTELDQRLEAVADAEHQAVAIIEEVTDGISDFGGAEECGDEFRRAIGLVATRESSGQHHDLAVADGGSQCTGALRNRLRAQVVDDHRLHLGAGTSERTGRIIFAVGAGEHRNHHPWLGDVLRMVFDAHLLRTDRPDLFTCRAVWENLFDPGFPGLLQRSQIEGLRRGAQRIVLAGHTDLTKRHILGERWDFGIRRQLNHEAAIAWLEEGVGIDAVIQIQTDAIAECHREQGLGQASVTGCRDGQCRTLADQGFHSGNRRDQTVCLRSETVLLVVGFNQQHAVARSLEFG